MTLTPLLPRRAVALPVTLALVLAGLLGAFGLPAAEAAAPPMVQPDSSTGVTTDVLPTTQIDAAGWVDDQAIAGDTVYAGGSFSSARPAGAAPGTNETARHNLLAYSISTGELVGSFAPDVNGEVRVLALSPDGSRLYAGGDFTAVDGVQHNRLVAFDTATGKVDPAFAVDLGDSVHAISVAGSGADSTVYVGGRFSQANGYNRGRLAAFRASDGRLLSGWAPKTSDGKAVEALLVAPGGRVVAGGHFGSITSGSTTVTARGSASLDPSTGAAQDWAVNKVVKQYGDNGAVLSLHTDGTTVYGSGYWYNGTESNFEGVWAVKPSDGSITWLADCHGDTYDTTVANGVVYAASHQHDCSNIGSFPQQRPTSVEWRGNAFTASAEGDVLRNSFSPTKFSDFVDHQAPAVVSWFPQFANPTCLAADCSDLKTRQYAGQPTLTVESTDDYVVMGGQFPTVNGKAQQGLVRFAKASIAPKKDGPRLYPGGGPTVRAVAGNVVRVTATPWDRDSSVLDVELWRTDKSSRIWPAGDDTSVPAVWWRPSVAYTDRDVTPGTTYKYYLKLKDRDGNAYTSSTVSVTPDGKTLSDSTYSAQVLSDGASSYWRLDDPPGPSLTDWAGKTDITKGNGGTMRAAGAIGSDPAMSVNATVNASAAATTGFVRAPQDFSVEAWFRTTSTTGGQVVGFGDVPTGSSYRHDRQVYLNPSGQVVYYLDQYGTARSLTSPKSYNDGKFHQVVASLSGSGMVLYVDGAPVASWSAVTSSRDYGGFWRVGADKLPGATSYLGGTLDDVSVYPAALSAEQVKDHYTDSGRVAPATPTAAFTATCEVLTCRFDASSSTPQVPAAKTGARAGAETADGTGSSSAATGPAAAIQPPPASITGYTWSFGDGASGKEAKASHRYTKAGTFDVSLTVTNSAGLTSTSTQTVEAAGNADPVASFTTTATGRKVTLDAARSHDSDGTVATYRWDLGDGSTSSAKKVTHTYAGTGDYPVTLRVTDNHGGSGSVSRVVRVGKALAADAFQRTGSRWGTADKGGSWSTSPADAFTLDGSRGRVRLSRTGGGASASLAKVSTKKANVVGDVTLEKAGSGSGTTAAYVLRQRSNAGYRAKLVLRSGRALSLVATRVVSGKETVVKTATVPGVTYQAGDVLRLRASITSAKKAKIKVTVWHAGSKEPTAQLSATDSTTALRKSGAVGVWGQEAGSTTPVVLGFDNLLVTAS